MKIRGYRITILCEALLTLLKWDMTIRHRGFSRWKRHLNDYPLKKAAKLDEDGAKRLNAHIECIVRNFPTELNCMRRSLALKTMLARRHINTELHIGVKFDEQNQLSAHAWLSLDNALLNDSHENIDQYTEITENREKFIA